MRIKRVEIIGFKSFCDRAVVQIGESITGVVGPNGCGKSNIVDAIRWCMGEQSAKHLRGKAMEDVIFAGSETRGPAPMAEVSLTFDDVGFSAETLELAKTSDEAATEQALESLVPEEEPQAAAQWTDAEGNPIASPLEEAAAVLADAPPAFDFAHYTEVTITRRLYRDGLSQYFINKTPCRLRDITDFFLGTGVGTKAYAIIEQGRIGQIVSSRPQDRRAIIEEAAGITKFKAKKKAAEKKLDQTRQNLMRVSDIVGELDKRMGTLRRQAQKAERYRKYKTEVKDIELWKFAHRWLELAGEGRLVTERLGEARTERETTQTSWVTKDAHVVTERAELSLEERRLLGIQEQVYELDNRLRLGESKIGFERREAEELDGRINLAQTEIESIIAQRAAANAELAQRETELVALEAEVARESEEVATREVTATEARQMLVNTQSRLDEARAEISSRRTEIAAADAQLESLIRRRDEAARRLERVLADTEQHQSRAKELERESKHVNSSLSQLRQTRLDLGSQSSDFETRRTQLATDTAANESVVETLKAELSRRTSRLSSLREIQDRYEGFDRGTRAVMQHAERIITRDVALQSLDDDAIRGIVADIVRAPEHLEVAVEAALGDRLGGILVHNAHVGVAAIGFLKQTSAGRSAFISVEPRPAAPAQASQPVRFEGEGGASSFISPAWESSPSTSPSTPAAMRRDAELEVQAIPMAAPRRDASAAADLDAQWSAEPSADHSGATPVLEHDVLASAPIDAGPDTLAADIKAELAAPHTESDLAAPPIEIELASSGVEAERAASGSDAELAASGTELAASGTEAELDAARIDTLAADIKAELGAPHTEGDLAAAPIETELASHVEADLASGEAPIETELAPHAEADLASHVEADLASGEAPIETELAPHVEADLASGEADLSASQVDAHIDTLAADIRAELAAPHTEGDLAAAPIETELAASGIDAERAASGTETELAPHVEADLASGEADLAASHVDARIDTLAADIKAELGAPHAEGDLAAAPIETGLASHVEAALAATHLETELDAARIDTLAADIKAELGAPHAEGDLAAAPIETELAPQVEADLASGEADLAASHVDARIDTLTADIKAELGAPHAEGDLAAAPIETGLASHVEADLAATHRETELDAARMDTLAADIKAELRAPHAEGDLAAAPIETGLAPHAEDDLAAAHIDALAADIRAELAAPHAEGDLAAAPIGTEIAAPHDEASAAAAAADTYAEATAAAERVDSDDLAAAHRELAVDALTTHVVNVLAGRTEGVVGRLSDLVAFVDGYEEIGKRLLAKTLVVDDLARAIELHRSGVTDRLVTLDGDIVDEDGVVWGGSRDARGAGVLAQKREIRDLEEMVGKLEHDLAEATAKLLSSKAELAQVTKAIEGLRKQVHEGEIAITGHEKDEARVRVELDRHREQLGRLGTEQLELDDRLRTITGDEQSNREKRTAAVARIEELERAQLDLLSDVTTHRERLEDLANMLTDARIRAAQLGEKRAAAEAATLRLQRTDAELGTRADRLAEDIETASRRATTLREGCDQLAAELALVREQRDGEVRLLDEGRTAYQQRLSGLTEVEMAARELRTRADRLASEVNQLELRDGQVRMTRQVVEDQVNERYQIEVPSVLTDYHLRPAVSDTEESRLTELRELIERMGTDINLTAIEEYAEVSTRFEFLSAQKIDLERAVDQLQRAIDKINRTSRKLFKDTFDAVNATFKEVYPRLFRGGQASLSLTMGPERGANANGANANGTPADGDAAGAGNGGGGKQMDLLEAGIEIMAQPPGKKNTTVDQLSGGEKALTAVALVFSIFLIKPSPFCILDEVDAPLDEANVDRYNEIVREMTDRSQFIVITHNKRTMEAADTLYGVTMQEPGVSKLVSVNLSRLGSRPGDMPGVGGPSKDAAKTVAV